MQMFSTLFFFALTVWVLASLLRSPKGRQILLLLASYLFYANWGIGFLSLLIFSSLVNYLCGQLMQRRATAGPLWLGIVMNLALLTFFKYLPPMFGEEPQGSGLTIFLHEVVMPVGMSFWTFQALSYLFDLYRGERLDPSLLEFCLYMAFAPTVLSGPVCRLPNMLPQFREVYTVAWDDITTGTRRLLIGLFMKVVLGQVLGAGLNPGEGISAGFDKTEHGWGGIDVWLLAIGFGFQLFFDFAGYSHIVIGVARIFGIRLEENFDRPFLSLTPSVFWTRWHMSLSFWIRDYVFLPLATMRREAWWRYLALVLAMVLFGLWHAAKATFILWGFYQGLLLVLHRVGQQFKRRLPLVVDRFGTPLRRPPTLVMPFAWPSYLGSALGWVVTFPMISLGWILFRARDLDQALTMLSSVFSLDSYHKLGLPRNFYIVTSIVLVGYFAFHALASLFAHLKVMHEQAWKATKTVWSWTDIAAALGDVFWQRRWWWLVPMMLVLLLNCALIIQERPDLIGQKLAVSPFIYTVF